MDKSEFIQHGKTFARYLVGEAQERIDRVKMLDSDMFIHEHFTSASSAALNRMGFYCYRETTPVLALFDKYLTKRDRKIERGIRDVMGFAEDSGIVIVEIESWKELVWNHIDELINRIEELRKIPSDIVQFNFHLVFILARGRKAEKVITNAKRKLRTMSMVGKKTGRVTLSLQAIPSSLIIMKLDSTNKLELIEQTVFCDGLKL